MLFGMSHDVFGDYVLKQLAANTCKTFDLKFAAKCFLAFFVDCRYIVGVTPISGHNPGVVRPGEYVSDHRGYGIAEHEHMAMNNFCRHSYRL